MSVIQANIGTMTLCLGWKRDQDVYLVADSVVTARGGVMTRPVSCYEARLMRGIAAA